MENEKEPAGGVAANGGSALEETAVAGSARDAVTITVSPEALSPRPTRLDIDAVGSVTPECPGRYRLLFDADGDAEVGRGGIGRVLAVFDEHLGREVAQKEIQPGVLMGAAGFGDTTEYAASKISRFLREARVTGRLIHPNIVPVYEVGSRADGSLYYTMRLVHGRTLKEALKACASLDDRLALLGHFVDLCDAIAFAHSRGVIHRDIKPDNVMLGEFGETLVLDWGLAKIMAEPEPELAAGEAPSPGTSTDSGGLTADGSFMGTPSYVSPEQAAGRLTDVDERADIWSLGAVLYEILVGHPPFPGKTASEVLVRVLTDPVTPPRTLDPEIPPDLSSVCEKALGRDRFERYQSARLLSQEVEAFRSGRRVMAHEYSAWEHLKRFAVQKKGLIVAVASVLAVILAALIAVSSFYTDERAAKERAQAATGREQVAREKERAERLRASYHFAQGAAEKADRLAGERRALSSAVYAAAALAQNPANPRGSLHDPAFAAREPLSKALLLQSAGRLVQSTAEAFATFRRAVVGDRELNSAIFAPAGDEFALACRDGSVVIRGADDGGPRRTIAAHKGEAVAVAYSPNGRRLATCGKDGRVAIWDAASGRAVLEAGMPAAPLALGWSADGFSIAIGSEDGAVRLIDAADASSIATLEGHTGAVTSVAFSPDGMLLASAGRDRTVRLWDPAREKTVRVLEGHASVISRVVFSFDSRLLASSSYDKTARVWDVATGEERLRAGDHTDEVMTVDFSPDGRLIATACWDRAVRFFDVATGALLTRLDAHDDAVLFAFFMRNGAGMLTAGRAGDMGLWSLRPPPPILASPSQGYQWSAAWSPNGRMIATAGQDGTLRLWDSVGGRLERAIPGHEDYIQKIAFSPDGTLIASGGYDRVVRIRRVGDGEEVAALEGCAGTVRSVAWSPDGSRLVASCKDGAHLLWELARRKRLGEIRERKGQARAAAFSPDGRWLAVGGDDGILRLADPSTGRVLHELASGDHGLLSAAFSASGALVAACAKGEVIVWDARTRRIEKRLSRGAHDVYALDFSSDGALLAAASDDAKVTIWSVRGGEALLEYSLGQSVMTVDISPGGDAVLTADSDTGRVYPLDLTVLDEDPKVLLERAQQASGTRLFGFVAKRGEDGSGR